MKKGVPYILTIIAVLLSIVSCERDDLCVDTPITPFLVITFQDNDPSIDIKKRVISLQVSLIENNKPVFIEPVTTDSIRIPLNTITDKTKFQFTRNVRDANEDNTSFSTQSKGYLTNFDSFYYLKF